jgi:cyclopropane fatty-acyl-phospholipid synthase-like methyltransferase
LKYERILLNSARQHKTPVEGHRQARSFLAGRRETTVYQRRLTGLYDWLSRFNLLANKVQFGRSTADLTMHKTLRVPESVADRYQGRQQRLYINDQALAAAQLPAQPRVLDAGCGFGGTIFRWHEQCGGSYDGLTLSRVQWKLASREARRRGLQDCCRFYLRSYDEAIAARYDSVVSIEALIHSPRFEHSLNHLASALKPGGKLIVVEDIPLDEAAGDNDLELIRQYWGLAAVPTASTYRAALDASGLRVTHDEDYSAGFQTMPPEKIAQLQKRYLRIHAAIPWSGSRFVAAAFLCGLALERLYQKRLVRYRLIVAQRSGQGESA